MTKKIIGALLLIIFFIAAILTRGFGSYETRMSIEASLIKSMNSTNASVIESTISAWGKINDEFMTSEQVEAEINIWFNIIKPEKSTIKITKENNDELNKQTLCGSVEGKYYSVIVESINNEKGGESFVIIDISIDKDSSELITERQRLMQYFDAKGSKPNISSCIIGMYDGKLTENEIHARISNAMSTAKAKKVEGISSDEINSISAFSGNINSFVLSNKKKINMQIAMRYSSYDNKTYIWIGSPLINVEY